MDRDGGSVGGRWGDRQSQGLERLDDVKFAVLERDGSISIVPRS